MVLRSFVRWLWINQLVTREDDGCGCSSDAVQMRQHGVRDDGSAIRSAAAAPRSTLCSAADPKDQNLCGPICTFGCSWGGFVVSAVAAANVGTGTPSARMSGHCGGEHVSDVRHASFSQQTTPLQARIFCIGHTVTSLKSLGQDESSCVGFEESQRGKSSHTTSASLA